MILWSAFLMGFLGSLHCAGMCGPLVLALPRTGGGRISFIAGRMAYNFGRIVTYMMLGLLFGMIGKSFRLAGIQRWISLVAGTVVILASLGIASKGLPASPFSKFYSLLKRGLGMLIRKRTYTSTFAIGLLNGLLPCGLVYMACAVSIATGELLDSVAYMALFGLGTVPMLLGISIMGGLFPVSFRQRLQRTTPYFLAFVGVLLVLRGMSLGIPYLSPDMSTGHAHCSACH